MAILISPPTPELPSPTRCQRPSFKLAHSLSAHSRAVTALRFSSDGKVLVSAGADGYFHLWQVPSRSYRVKYWLTWTKGIRGHSSINDPYALTGQVGVSGFRASNSMLIQRYLGINDISFSPDSLYLATASDDTTCLIHALHPLPSPSASSSRPAPLRILSAHTAPVLAVAFSPKSNLLVTGSFDESAIIWDVKNGTALRVLPAHADAVWTVGWDGEGGMVLTGSADGLVRLWDANSGQCLKTLDNDTNSPVSFATFTPSPFFLLSATLSSTLRVYNFATSKVLKTLRAPGVYVSDKHPCPAVVFGHEEVAKQNGLSVSSNSSGRRKRRESWVVTGSENGKVVIWDLGSRRVLQVLEGEGSVHSPVVAVAVHPDGRTIASGSLEPERLIQMWRDDHEDA